VGISYSVAPYGLHAPLPQGSVWEPAEPDPTPLVAPAVDKDPGLTTTTDIDGTLTIGRFVVRLLLSIRRSR
jgi:hypothetical protein